jgi:hypothetical protein
MLGKLPSSFPDFLPDSENPAGGLTRKISD